MDGMEIFKQDVCRAALECNANLVVCCYIMYKAVIFAEQNNNNSSLIIQ